MPAFGMPAFDARPPARRSGPALARRRPGAWHSQDVRSDSASPSRPDPPDDLAARVRAASHLTGEFLLRSGRVSNEYFDKYLFEADPVLLADIVEGMCALLPPGDAILAGLELGGIPLVTLLSARTGRPARFVRKKAKEYGTRRVAEGGDLSGRVVVLIEDVVTSGGAVVEAATVLRAEGAVVNDVLCVIDRQEGGRDNLAAIGLTLRPLLTRADLDAAG